MKKKIITTILLSLSIVSVLSACGEIYTCSDCEKTTSKAYYDVSGDKEDALCAECAEEYWAPLDYENYRIK